MTKGFTLAVAVFLGVAAVDAADWPQWQGPDRTRNSKETGLLKEWPSGGPRVRLGQRHVRDEEIATLPFPL